MGNFVLFSGCVLDRDNVYLSTVEEEMIKEAVYCRMGFFNPTRSDMKWRVHDLEHAIRTVGVWQKSSNSPKICYAISDEGFVEMIRDGQPFYERISTAPYGEEGSIEGPLVFSRQIGNALYAFGPNYQIFRRSDDGWAVLPQPDIPMLRDHPSVLMHDVNGFSEDAICAVGILRAGVGFILSRINGNWGIVDDQVGGYPNCIECSERGGLYIAGSMTSILYGDPVSGFKEVASIPKKNRVLDMAEFNGVLYLAMYDGIHTLSGPGRSVTPAHIPLVPPLRDPSVLEARDGVLWSFNDLGFSALRR